MRALTALTTLCSVPSVTSEDHLLVGTTTQALTFRPISLSSYLQHGTEDWTTVALTMFTISLLFSTQRDDDGRIRTTRALTILQDWLQPGNSLPGKLAASSCRPFLSKFIEIGSLYPGSRL
jgi:hypothetical protein